GEEMLADLIIVQHLPGFPLIRPVFFAHSFPFFPSFLIYGKILEITKKNAGDPMAFSLDQRRR
ncbi:hypothetical protein QUV96_04005, partial [Amedibacillus dolichus]